MNECTYTHIWTAALTMKDCILQQCWTNLKMSRSTTKPTKWHVCPVKTQISPSIHPVWSVLAVCSMKKTFFTRQQRRISLDGCTGWSESSLGTQVILSVLSCSSPFEYNLVTRPPYNIWTNTLKMSKHSLHWYLGRVKRIWYLSPMRAARVQASLGIPAVSPEPPLLAHTSSESRGTFRQKARSLAPLSDWACAVKICHDGMLEDTNSLDGAHLNVC